MAKQYLPLQNAAKLALARKIEPSGAFYKHLMSGVSQMLSFVIGGGILVALLAIDKFTGHASKDHCLVLVLIMY